MFTGIVEGTGSLREVKRKSGSVVFGIDGGRIGKALKKGDSIAIEGVCLTVTAKRKSVFTVQAVEETLKKTTLGELTLHDAVNLERPLRASSRLGGHFVLGHVDGVGRVLKVDKRAESWMFWISIPKRFREFLIPVGSVAVNGVSLTVASLKEDRFGISIIPHTWKVTTFRDLAAGSRVNIEFDMLGKYAVKLLSGRRGRK